MKNTVLGLLRLTRPDLSFAAGLCVVIGQLLAAGQLPPLHIVAAGFLSVACISAAILIMNDCLDVATDMVNAPQRPIPSGLVSKNLASVFSVLLFALGLLGSLLVSAQAFVVAVLLAVIGALYNRRFKQSGLLGNLLVSFSVGMTFVFGGITVGNPLEKTVLFFAVLTALIDLGEEISADVMDVDGDAATHSKSLAILYGNSRAMNTASALFAGIIVLLTIPFLLNWFSLWYALPLGSLAIVIAFAVIKFRTAPARGRAYIKLIYRGGTIAMLVFLVMKLAGV